MTDPIPGLISPTGIKGLDTVLLPIKEIVSDGLWVHVLDTMGARVTTVTCTSGERAVWVGWSLAKAHGVPYNPQSESETLRGMRGESSE